MNSCSSTPASVTSSVRSATGSEPELLRDDLALLGDLDASVDRARRQRGERAIDRRSAAAPDAAAAAVKERQLDPGLANRSAERFLRAVERPRRRDHAGVLAGIGVADHHFLPAAARRELPRVDGIVEQRAHHRRRAARDRRASRTAARRRGATPACSPARSTSPASRASSSTRSRSSGDRVIETMYVHAAASPSFVLDRARSRAKVSSTLRVVVASSLRRARRAAGCRAARERSARRRAAAVRRSRRCRRRAARVHVGVIAHVHHEAVKAVRAHAREQRIERRAARLLRARRERGTRARAADPLERRGVAIRRRLLRRPAGVARRDEPPRRLDARRHEAELEPQRLVGIALAVRLPHGRQQLRDPSRATRAARRVGGAMSRRERQPLDQLVERAPIAAEYDVAGAARRGDRDLRRDERIAVAIAADPVAEPQRHRQPERIGRRGSNSSSNARTSASRAARARVEQARLEVPEHRAHLVEHRRPILPHLARSARAARLRPPAPARSPRARRPAPCSRASSTSATRAWRPSSVRRVDSVGCAVSTGRTSSAQHRAARRRRRCAPSLRSSRIVQRADAGCGSVAVAPQVRVAAPHAVHLLGGVDQQEEERECARRDRALLDGKPSTRRSSSSSEGASGVAVPARAACATRRRSTMVERLLALEPPDDAPERARQPANILVEREVFASRRGRAGHPGRYETDGRRGYPAAA